MSEFITDCLSTAVSASLTWCDQRVEKDQMCVKGIYSCHLYVIAKSNRNYIAIKMIKINKIQQYEIK